MRLHRSATRSAIGIGDVVHASLTRAEKRGLRGSTGLTFGTDQWSVMGLRTKLRRRRGVRHAFIAVSALGAGAMLWTYAADAVRWLPF